jgi:hypothetical protein
MIARYSKLLEQAHTFFQRFVQFIKMNGPKLTKAYGDDEAEIGELQGRGMLAV